MVSLTYRSGYWNADLDIHPIFCAKTKGHAVRELRERCDEALRLLEEIADGLAEEPDEGTFS